MAHAGFGRIARTSTFLLFFLSFLSLVASLAGCTVENGPAGRRDTGVGPTTDTGVVADAGDAGMDAGGPVDANLPRDTNPPQDTNTMVDAVGGGAGLMCTACTTNADCRAGSFCVQLASSGDRVCLQSCDTELPTCPRRFDCLNSVLTPLPGPVCTPVGERCCIDSDEDDYGFGVGCRGPDCDEGNPAVYFGAPEACNGSDDDCDGTPDDGNPGGGNLCASPAPGVCSAGMTMCTAGAITCDPIVAVGAMTETCDGQDDDCDGPVDEGFAFMGDPLFPTVSFPLHNACSVGLGACRRAGAVVCSADHASAVCNAVSATPAAETCNYVDDDCNGTVDDAFVDSAGVYDADTDCGACGIDCTTIYAHPGSFGTCSVAAGRATCVMNCMPGAFNLNGIPDDGCEFALDPSAIYVSGEDAAAADDASCGLGPVASGMGNHPCRTIAYGQGRATASGRSRVLVADALYNESLTLVQGQSLMGGYRADTWERHLTTTLTTIRGTTGSGHRRTITATGITSGLLEGFVIVGASATSLGANSYAVYVSGGTSGLQIRNNIVYAGDGAPGTPGTPGTDGARGSAGAGGAMAFDTGTGSCGSSSLGGAGGSLSCGGTSVSGGSGGSAVCPMLFSSLVVVGSSRGGGSGAGPSGGSGGVPAYDGQTQQSSSCLTCFLGGGGTMTGGNGMAGATGSNGGSGAGAASGAGGVSGSDWVGSSGGPGGAAVHGSGGGGGGSGGGGDGQSGSCTDDLGATGGGGGSGGCAGSQGIGGSAGGGSFGIFIVGTTSYPVLMGNTIYRGFGGVGGNGGRGGAGGVGGAGAPGGLKSNANASFCTGDGGYGGAGGNGGHGGGGGGGAGGVSYAVYTAGTTGYGATGNTFPTSGGGGSGGGGGPSLGTSGTPGVSGASGSTN